MAAKHKTHDGRAIEAIIDRQLRSLGWSKGRDGDWATFTADFYTDAMLYPATTCQDRLCTQAGGSSGLRGLRPRSPFTLHRVWIDETDFRWGKDTTAAV